MNTEEELMLLDLQIEQALKKLRTEKQRRFATAYPMADSGAKALIEAGYSPESAGRNIGQVMRGKGMQEAISLIRRRHALAHGIDPRWKRQKLVNIAETAGTPGGNWQPNAATRAVELLCRIDGDITSQSAAKQAGTNLNIQIITGVPKRDAIDGEVIVEKLPDNGSGQDD